MIFIHRAVAKLIWCSVVALLIVFSASIASAATILQLAIEQTAEEAKLVLRADVASLQAPIFTLSPSPPEVPLNRVVVDIPARLSAATTQSFESGAFVHAMRLNRRDGGTRIVLDLNSKPSLRPVESQGADFYELQLQLTPARSESADTRVAARQPNCVQDTEINCGRDLVIVIDAGHGGRDPGAVRQIGRRTIREKTTVLSIGSYLRRLLGNLRGFKIVMTRETDVYVPLRQRYALARSEQADLFLSLHADAAPNSRASGVSIYTLSRGNKLSDMERFLEEHANRELDEVAARVGGIDLENDADLNQAVVELAADATQRQSARFAELLLSSFRRAGIELLRDEPGRANFVVLRSPDVPSVLIETGFLTNTRDARNLDWGEHRRNLAWTMMQGVLKHFEANPPPGSHFEVAAREFLEYRVVAGDNMSTLAQRYRTSVREILSLNELQRSDLFPGQYLRIPNPIGQR